MTLADLLQSDGVGLILRNSDTDPDLRVAWDQLGIPGGGEAAWVSVRTLLMQCQQEERGLISLWQSLRETVPSAWYRRFLYWFSDTVLLPFLQEVERNGTAGNGVYAPNLNYTYTCLRWDIWQSHPRSMFWVVSGLGPPMWIRESQKRLWSHLVWAAGFFALAWLKGESCPCPPLPSGTQVK